MKQVINILIFGLAVLFFFAFLPAINRMNSPAQALTPPPVFHLNEIEDKIFDLTNKMRREYGVHELKLEDVLRDTARRHSDDMILRNFFSHNNPDGLSPEDRICIEHRRLIGITSENIWYGSGYDPSGGNQIAEMVMTDWMNSPGHRRNILDPEFNHLGVGVSFKAPEIRVTQNFAAVFAYITAPVPLKVKRGEKLNLDATPVSSSVRKPTLFDFYMSKTDRAAGEAMSISSAKTDAPPGVYKLRFYFPDESGMSFMIYTGPQIEIE